MRCTVCNAYIPEGAGQCLECGAGPDPEQVCQKCGTLVGGRARFCRKCGAPMLGPVAPAKPVQAAPLEGLDSSKCAQCGSYVPVGIRYCPECGSEQKKPMVLTPAKPAVPAVEVSSEALLPAEGEAKCPACGTEPRGSGRFCHECGRFLRTDLVDIICHSCGSIATLRYSRCQHCGSDLPSRPEKNK